MASEQGLGRTEAFTSTPLLDYDEDRRRYNEDADDATIVRSTRIVWLVFIVIAVFFAWSYFAEVAEVTTGQGSVVPSSNEQIIQSLEGGILVDLRVREGDTVEQGEVLARLNPVQSESRVEESAARYRAALASVARLQAEVNGTPLEFPAELDDYPELISAETRLYETRRNGLASSLQGINETRAVVKQELDITRSLAQAGAASNVEVLRLQRQISELDLQAADKRSEYMVMARESLAKSKADVEALSAEMRGRSESLSRTTVYSPMRGIVKDIEVTTQGGVIPPNGRLMAIVPLDDQLLIRARVSPRDIAFVYPGQPAKVKITAYDYNIYGGLDGEVVRISPDTIQDEIKPEMFYYEVLIRTEEVALESDAGKRFHIVPGMIATVDIRTGEKTVFDYLVKPISQAKESLRER